MATPSPTSERLPPPKRLQIDFGNETIILVGPDERRFFVHRDVICATSDFFRAACNGDWQESKEKTVRLPEQEPLAFDVWLNWRYMSTLELSNGETSAKMWTDKRGMTWQQPGQRFKRLIDSFILGDMLGDRLFRNALIDAWFKLCEATSRVPTLPETNYVFENLPASSKLRLLLTDELAFDVDHEQFAKGLDDYDPQIWKAIAEVSVRYQGEDIETKKPKIRGKCFYHEHVEGEEKCE